MYMRNYFFMWGMVSLCDEWFLMQGMVSFKWGMDALCIWEIVSVCLWDFLMRKMSSLCKELVSFSRKGIIMIGMVSLREEWFLLMWGMISSCKDWFIYTRNDFLCVHWFLISKEWILYARNGFFMIHKLSEFFLWEIVSVWKCDY